MITRLAFCGFALLHVPLISTAQLFVGTSGNDLFISQGSSLYYDGLQITAPAGGLGLSGTELNRFQQSVGGPNGPSSIVRTYGFNPAVSLSGVLEIFYDDAELNGNTESQLEMVFGHAGNWQTTTGSVVNTSGNVVSYTVNNVTVGALTAVTGGTVLSLVSNSFAARLTEAGVLVSWKVSDNRKYRLFEVERSANGHQWMKTGSVFASGAEGSGDYSMMDGDSRFQLRYYRLKMLGADGAQSYSATVALTGGAQSAMQVAARSGGFHIRFDGWQPAVAQLVDAQGRVLRTAKDCAIWEESGLAPGFYLIRLSDGARTTVQKIAIR